LAIPIRRGQKAPLWVQWQLPQTTYEDRGGIYPPAENYDAQGCGVGFRCGVDLGDGTCFLGVDVDVRDSVLAAKVGEMLAGKLGITRAKMYRVGQAPKRLYPIRVSVTGLGPSGGKQFKPISMGHLSGHAGDKVEMMYRGKQFVVWGEHPSGVNYSWFIHGSNQPCCDNETVFEMLKDLDVTPMNMLGWGEH
jgi:hypothetical protein